MMTTKRYTSHQIRDVADSVWSSLDPIPMILGISPLYEMISSYPIRTAEINGLTFQSAADFLTSETSQVIPVPENGDQLLAGFLFIQRFRNVFYGCILIEQRDSIVRRRFSAAHELGHYLLHFLPVLESLPRDVDLILAEGLIYSKDSTDDLPTGKLAMVDSPNQDVHFNFIGNELVEREANQFAAELLVPEGICKLMYQSFSQKYGTKRQILTKKLATEFLVSTEAMKWRLAALKLQGS
jgi:Zn-dependent peptidase ImmA (M78 family)